MINSRAKTGYTVEVMNNAKTEYTVEKMNKATILVEEVKQYFV